ncbi:hypothetical protein BD560DRAFT_384089, partial [Blakeslea trispora]
MLFLFPLEIVNCIAFYLSQKDYYELLLVNRTCHHQFIPFFYRQMQFKDEDEFEQFLYQSKHYHLHVRDLKLPYFKSVEQTLAQLPSAASSKLHQIQSLTMKCFMPLTPSLETVAAMPCLTHLNFSLMSAGETTIDLLENLHALCPLLMRLHIQGPFGDVSPRDSEPRPMQVINKLKTLEINSTSHSFKYRSWLKYIANTYPNLEMLKLGDCKFDNELDYTDGFYDWFRMKCPRLVQFEWTNIYPDHGFLEKLDQQQCQLQTLTLHHLIVARRFLIHLEICYRDYPANIFNLDIKIADDTSYKRLCVSLGRYCTRLQQLSVEQSCTYSPDELYIDRLLDFLPCLKAIRLSGIRIATQQISRDVVPHSLKQIELRHCYLPQDGFSSISRRCLHLKSLVLYQTVHTDGSVRIHLPYQQLNRVEINSIYSAKSDIKAVVRFFFFKQVKRYDCYFMDSFEKRAYSRETIAKSFKKLNVLPSPSARSDGLPCELKGSSLWIPHKAGSLYFVCSSVNSVHINSKKV